MSLFMQRKSVRHYDENYKINREELEEILLKTLRAPSSMNLQPTRLVVVETKEGKEKVKDSLYGNNLQLETSSAFIILFTDLKKYDNAEKIFNKAVKENLMPQDVAERQIEMISNMEKSFTKEQILRDGLIDGGLMAMQLMLVAKEHGYDTCAIGGFNKDTIAESVGLDKNRYEPVLIVSLGKAKEKGFDSVRLSIKDTTKFL